MGLLKLVDGEVVGYDEPFEAPLLAQDLRQQLVRGSTRHAVQLIVPVHDAVKTCFAHCGLEGAQEHLAQLAGGMCAGFQFMPPSVRP